MPLTLSDALETTRSQIPYWELAEGYRENWMEDNSNLTRRLACLWGERFAFMNDLLGSAESIGGKLYRDLPEEDAESEGYFAIGGSLVQGAGYGGRNSDHSMIHFKDRSTLDNNEPTDGLAIYDITYTKPVYELTDDAEAHEDEQGELSRYVIREREFNAEALPLPSRYLQWESAPHNQIPGAAPIIFPKGIYYYTWKMVPEDAWDENTALNTQGTVNKVQFDGKFAAETLLCLGPKVRKFQHGNGAVYLDVTYVFEYKQHKHNKFLRVDRPNSVPAFEYVRRTNQPSERVFLKTDFLTNLFTVI